MLAQSQNPIDQTSTTGKKSEIYDESAYFRKFELTSHSWSFLQGLCFSASKYFGSPHQPFVQRKEPGFQLVHFVFGCFYQPYWWFLIHTEWFTLLALSIFNIEKENELKPAIAIIPQNQGAICCFADCHFTCLVHSSWLVSTEISGKLTFSPQRSLSSWTVAMGLAPNHLAVMKTLKWLQGVQKIIWL